MQAMQIVNEQNANNGDDGLFVQFFKSPVIKEFESEQQGRPIYEERLMVRIQAPGDMLNVVEREAWEGDFRRFPRQYNAFQAQDGGNEMHGTPISEWPSLNRAQVEELKALKFYTVEQLATASDTQLQRIGMGGLGLRQRAQAWLAVAKDTALVQHQTAELSRRDNEIADLKEQIGRLAKMMEEGKRGPGRPRKEDA